MQWIVNAWFCREIVLPFLQQSEGRSIDKGCQIDSILTDTKNHFLLIFLIYEFFFRFVYGRVGSVCVFRKTNALALRNCQTRFLTTFDIHFWFQISQIGGKISKGLLHLIERLKDGETALKIKRGDWISNWNGIGQKESWNWNDIKMKSERQYFTLKRKWNQTWI